MVSLLFIYINGITGKVYNLKEVKINENQILKIIQQQSRTSCILRCQRHNECEKSLHEEYKRDDGIGSCTLISSPKQEEDDKKNYVDHEVYEKVGC